MERSTGMMDSIGGMLWGMGLIWPLVLLVLGLSSCAARTG